MTDARAILLCLLLPAVVGVVAHAQSADPKSDQLTPKTKGSVQIRFIVEDDQNTFSEWWREEDDGPFVLALPYAVELRYSDGEGTSNERKLTLLADRALIWFEPGNGQNVQGDPFLAMSQGAQNLQFYGEGHIWMKYNDSVTVRADRVFLDFSRNKLVTYDANGEETVFEELNLKGTFDNVRAHSGAENVVDSPGGNPLKAGIGTDSSAGDANDTTRDERVGAAPSEDAVPATAGRQKSLPQEQGLRLFLRAQQLRIVSLNKELQEIELEEGSVSSSSLAIASYSLFAEEITIRLTSIRGTVYMTRPAVRILDYPLLTLPVDDYAYDIDSQPPIRQLDIFLSDQRFGYGFRTYIDAVATYDFFADPEPPFNPLHLGPQIDYYSRRGLGLGANLDWGGISPFRTYGAAMLRSLYINDPGDKRKRARDLGWYPVEKHSRGRIWGAYSQNFGDGWQIDHLLNYSSDSNFRREFYESEYDNNELEDSFIQLTKRYNNLNFFLLLEPKVHPWQSKTEYLPTLGFDTSRIVLGDFGLQFSSHTEASIMRFRPGDGDDRDEVSTLRADSNSQFNLPFEVGPFAIDPFVGSRVTVAANHLKMNEANSRPGLSGDGTFPGYRAGDQQQTGILYRFLPFVGVNMQTFFTGTWGDVQVPWLGIDGVRHVFAPFVRYTNVLYNSLDDIHGRAFIPLDVVDTLDEFHEIRVGFRNRVQTRQGWGDDRRTVDYFELMAELPIYPQRKRDNDGDLLGDLEVASVWRPAPGFAIAGRMFINPLSGNLNRASAEFRFDVLSFGQASIYYRLLKGQHQVVGIQGDLRVSELYRIGFKQEYDLQAGKFRETRIEVTRRILEAFDLGFVFKRDAVDGDVSFYLSLSAAFRGPSSSAGLLR
ncbi:MAG: LPS assembly protein LptD [Planctomycetota bacterium]